MRLLLISDAHGKPGVINEPAARAQADAVIHAGNFSFHDDESYERILAWGRYIKVLEPAELKKAVAEEIRAMAVQAGMMKK